MQGDCHGDRQADIQASRQTDKYTGKQADIQTGMETGREADRQAGRKKVHSTIGITLQSLDCNRCRVIAMPKKCFTIDQRYIKSLIFVAIQYPAKTFR